MIHVGSLRGADPLPADGSLLLAFDAHLRIEIDGRIWFEEPDFPVLELAVAVREWLRSGGSLFFDTMDADESPYLTVERRNGGYRLAAAWQSYSESRLLPVPGLETIFSNFALGVFQSIQSQFDVDVSRLDSGP